MKYLFTIVLLSCFNLNYAQTDYLQDAKIKLPLLKIELEEAIETYNEARKQLSGLAKVVSPSVGEAYDKVIIAKEKLEEIYDSAETSLEFYKIQGVDTKELDRLLILYTRKDLHLDLASESLIEQNSQIETYLLYGDNKLILKDNIIKNAEVNNILNTVINSDSETYFGDFWFPKDGQLIPVFKEIKGFELCDEIKKNTTLNEKEKKKLVRECQKKIKSKKVFEKLKFEEVKIEIHEGSIRDIRVSLIDQQGNLHIFSNSTPISLIRFNRVSGLNNLFHTSEQTIEGEDYSGFRLRVSDVLRYYYSVDGNFIPNDVSLSFPLIKDSQKTNINSQNRYELRQSTALNNVLDLRAYTDLFGLADAESNGIAQFEGRADFFVIPFNQANTNAYWLKKISPYASFTRFDDDDQVIESFTSMNGETTITNSLDHIQKTYFEAGLKLDLISHKFIKEMPFETSLYGVSRYQLSRLKLNENTGTENYSSLGLGIGLEFEFRRFSNFSLNYSVDLVNHKFEPFNDINGLTDQADLLVLRNELELSYFPAKSKSNSIFLRMRLFDDWNSEAGSSFFQAQFGYKFTLGAGNVTVNK